MRDRTITTLDEQAIRDAAQTKESGRQKCRGRLGCTSLKLLEAMDAGNL